MRTNQVISGNKPIFNNPTSSWEHNGSYSVELVPGTRTDDLPHTLERAVSHGSTTTLKAQAGRIKQTIGGKPPFYSSPETYSFTFYSSSGESYSGFPDRFIIAIKDGDGNLLWQNPNK